MNARCEKCNWLRDASDGDKICDINFRDYKEECEDFILRTGDSDYWPTEKVLESLKSQYEYICEQYREEFIRRYFSYDDLSYSQSWWIGDEPGGLLCLDSEFTFSFDTIRYCIDNNVECEELIKWYDYVISVADFSIDTPTIRAWVDGCPRISEDQLMKLSQLRQDYNDEIESTIESLKKEQQDQL